MAQITRDLEHQYRLVTHLIPDEVRKSIDQVELLDRLVHANTLVRKSQDAADPVLRKSYGELAQAVLRAQPRAVTDQQVAERIAKAATTRDQRQADALRAQADRIRERHPTAPRRDEIAKVAKAKAGQLPCYDAAGDLIGFCPPEALTPVQTVSAARIAKARRPGSGTWARKT
jgi:hypothetical protein